MDHLNNCSVCNIQIDSKTKKIVKLQKKNEK